MANAFVHMELTTDDPAAAKKFYKKVFDWTVTDIPKMKYSLIDTGDKKVGGGINAKSMPSQPTSWLVYAEVESVKKTIAKAEKAGAKTLLAFQDMGARGAIGVFVDPTGAAFGVWERATKSSKAAGGKKSASGKKPTKKR